MSAWVREEGERGGAHPRQQLRSLCVCACVLRPLGREARPRCRARAIGGDAEEELTS